tara:strand:+ start:2122 stop:2268 length:147 start_codon:yes stop_codon:yes gene_type:complete
MKVLGGWFSITSPVIPVPQEDPIIPNRRKATGLNEFRRYIDEKKFIID